MSASPAELTAMQATLEQNGFTHWQPRVYIPFGCTWLFISPDKQWEVSVYPTGDGYAVGVVRSSPYNRKRSYSEADVPSIEYAPVRKMFTGARKRSAEWWKNLKQKWSEELDT